MEMSNLTRKKKNLKKLFLKYVLSLIFTNNVKSFIHILFMLMSHVSVLFLIIIFRKKKYYLLYVANILLFKKYTYTKYR